MVLGFPEDMAEQIGRGSLVIDIEIDMSDEDG